MWCFHFGLCFIVRVIFIFTKEKLLLLSFSYHFIWWTKFLFYLYSVCPLIGRCQQSSLAITGSFLFYWRSYQSIGKHSILRNFWRKGNKFFFSWVMLDNLILMVQYTSVILDFLFFYILIICCLLYNWIVWWP